VLEFSLVLAFVQRLETRFLDHVTIMATATIETTSRLPNLSHGAFKAFCEDVSGTFGVEMTCRRRKVGREAVRDLRGRFQKLSAIHLVTAEGALKGTFHLFFDQGALFVLSGVIVMLPERRIREEAKRGSMADAENLRDAAREVGNLLVGSWDRVFRANCEGHGRFVKKRTVLGKLQENVKEAGLSDDDELLLVVYEVTVDSYPSFTCAAAFPPAFLRSDVLGPVVRESTGLVETSATGEPQGGIEKADAAVGTVEGEPTAAARGLAGPRDSALLHPCDVRPNLPFAERATTDLLCTPAAEIMQRNVVWSRPDDSVQDVIARMEQHNTRYVLVGHHGVLEGLVSGSNILAAVSLYLRPMFAKYRRPEDKATLAVKVKWIMSCPVRTVRGDAPLAKMMEMICRHGGHCLPVVSEEGRVQGIVTIFDILARVRSADGSSSGEDAAPQGPPLLP